MSRLELRFLGGVDVIRDGKSMTLPPSRKTRALLAYMALNTRAFRREHLCELLWEIPDDPRGSLRWSLSKLRRLVDDPDRPRIVADRNTVAFDASGVAMDVAELKRIAFEELEYTGTDELEAIITRHDGNFLEGLELSNFHNFHAWCVAERELVSRAQVEILRCLVARAANEPDRAVVWSRKLVGLSPYEEADRAALIRLLVASGRMEEAEQQYRHGLRVLREVGKDVAPILFEAWRGVPGGQSADKAPASPPLESPRVQSARLPLIGRDDEQAHFARLLDDASHASTTRMLFLSGVPGIGKSRLLDAAEDLAGRQGARVLRARSFESESMRPFAIWIDALRRWDAEVAKQVFDHDEFDNRDRLLDRLNETIRQLAGNDPLVLIFDDLQWCDESSATALHFVGRSNPDRPLVGLLAGRADEIRDNAALQKAIRGLREDGLLQEERLSPLSSKAIRELIQIRAPGANAQALGARCSGNPLLAIELVRAESSGEGAASLDRLIQERLSRFDLPTLEVIRWAAVLSPRISIELVCGISGVEAYRVSEAFELAEQQAMLEAADYGYRFTHDLIAQCIYQGISPARRQVMHRCVAEWLEKNVALDLGRAADMSHHAAQSGDARLAVRAMVSAGKLCLRFFANDDAKALAHSGMQWAAELPDPERVCMTLELQDVLLSAAPVDNWEGAAEEYVNLAEQALDLGSLSHARLGYHMASYLRWMHGHWTGAREETLQAERVSRGGTEEEHVVGMAETAKCLAMIERDLSDADAMIMEARALAERRHISNRALPMAEGILRYHESDLDRAEELFHEARTMCRVAGDRLNEYEAIEYLVMIEFERGRFEVAANLCQNLLKLGENIREGSEAPYARVLDAVCQYAIAGDDTALAPAFDALRAVDAKHRLAYTLIRTAFIDIDRSRAEVAVERAREALQYAELLDRASEIVMAHVAMARALTELGDGEQARMHAGEIRRRTQQPLAVWARKRGMGFLEQAGP